MRRWRWQPPRQISGRGPGGHLIEDGGRWRYAGYAFVDAFGLLAGAGERGRRDLNGQRDRPRHAQ